MTTPADVIETAIEDFNKAIAANYSNFIDGTLEAGAFVSANRVSRASIKALRDVLSQIQSLPPPISIDPDRMGGEPCLTGTRIPIAQVFAEIADGRAVADIADDMSLDVGLVQAGVAAILAQTEPSIPVADVEEALKIEESKNDAVEWGDHRSKSIYSHCENVLRSLLPAKPEGDES